MLLLFFYWKDKGKYIQKLPYSEVFILFCGLLEKTGDRMGHNGLLHLFNNKLRWIFQYYSLFKWLFRINIFVNCLHIPAMCCILFAYLLAYANIMFLMFWNPSHIFYLTNIYYTIHNVLGNIASRHSRDFWTFQFYSR